MKKTKEINSVTLRELRDTVEAIGIEAHALAIEKAEAEATIMGLEVKEENRIIEITPPRWDGSNENERRISEKRTLATDRTLANIRREMFEQKRIAIICKGNLDGLHFRLRAIETIVRCLLAQSALNLTDESVVASHKEQKEPMVSAVDDTDRMAENLAMPEPEMPVVSAIADAPQGTQVFLESIGAEVIVKKLPAEEDEEVYPPEPENNTQLEIPF